MTVHMEFSEDQIVALTAVASGNRESVEKWRVNELCDLGVLRDEGRYFTVVGEIAYTYMRRAEAAKAIDPAQLVDAVLEEVGCRRCYVAKEDSTGMSASDETMNKIKSDAAARLTELLELGT